MLVVGGGNDVELAVAVDIVDDGGDGVIACDGVAHWAL